MNLYCDEGIGMEIWVGDFGMQPGGGDGVGLLSPHLVSPKIWAGFALDVACVLDLHWICRFWLLFLSP